MNESYALSPNPSRANLRVVGEEDRPAYDAPPKHAPGFAVIPAAIFELQDGDALAVFAILQKHADRQTGECWPSMKRLEECLGWSDTRIRPALKRLVDVGYVVVEKRKLNGMDQANLYRLTANVRVSQHETPVSHSEALGISPRGAGYLTTRHEQEPIEIKPKEQEKTPISPKTTTLPENGPAQQLVKAWCELVDIPAPADYRKQVGAAQAMVKAGVTPEDIPDLYAFVSKWAQGADLALMRGQVDKWRAAKASTASNGGPNTKPYWQWTRDEIGAELRRYFDQAMQAPPDLLAAAEKAR